MRALKADLREALLAYRRERPHLSLRSIAKNSGCNRYFLTKLMSLSDISCSLDLNQVLILSQYLTGKASVREAIEHSRPAIREYLGKIFHSEFMSSREVSSRMGRVDLHDPYNYFVLVLASYARGSERDLVNKILGYKGELALRKLLNDGIVEEVEGRIYLREGNEITLSIDVMKERIPDFLRYHALDSQFRQRNFIHIYSEGLTEGAIRKVYEIHAKMNSEISKILMDKSNHGDIPFFSFGCMDRLYDDHRQDEIDGSSSEDELETREDEIERCLLESCSSQKDLMKLSS